MEKTTQMLSYNTSLHSFICQGEWNIQHISSIKDQIKNQIQYLNTHSFNKANVITINGQSITKLDAAGVWLLIQLKKKLEKKIENNLNKIDKINSQVHFENFSPQHRTLIKLIETHLQKEATLKPEKERKPFWLVNFGRYIIT